MLVVMWKYDRRNMTEKSLFNNVLFLILAIIFSAISQCSSVLSDKRSCYDPDCSEPISLARTISKYFPNEQGLLAFDVNLEVIVYGKEAGTRTDLWDVEINGKRGYVPKRFLREFKVLHKDLKYIVSTTPLVTNTNVPNKKHKPKENNEKSKFDGRNDDVSTAPNDNLDLKSINGLPPKEINATPSVEIIDGTTLHLDQNVPSIQSTPVLEDIKSTVVPNKHGVVDNSRIKPANGETESNIFTENNKVPKLPLVNKLENEEQSVFNKVDIKDFVTSEEKLDLPEVTGVQVQPLNTSIIANKVDHELESAKDVSTSDVKNAQNFKKALEEQERIQSIRDIDKIDAKDDESLENKGAITNSNPTSEAQISKGLDKLKIEESESLKNKTVVATNASEADVHSTENLDKIKKKGSQNLDKDVIASTDYTNPNLQIAKNSHKLETKENIQPLETEAGVITSDAKVDIQAAESSDRSEPKDSQSLESVSVDVSDDQPDVQNVENLGSVGTDDAELSKSSDTKAAVLNKETLGKINIKNKHSLENINIDTKAAGTLSESIRTDATKDIQFDVEKTKSSDKIQRADTNKSELIIDANNNSKLETGNVGNIAETTKDIQFDVEKTKSSNKIQRVDANKSELTIDANNNSKLETGNVENIAETTKDIHFNVKETKSPDKIQMADTNKSELIIDANNNSKLEIRNVGNIAETTKDIQFDVEKTKSPDKIQMADTNKSELIIDANNNSKLETGNVGNIAETTKDIQFDVEKTKSSNKIQRADTNKSGLIIDANNNSKLETGNVENIAETTKEDVKFVNSSLMDTKELPTIGDATQLEKDQSESEKENENQSTDDLSKYNNNAYGSLLFLQLNTKNEVPMTIPSNNIEAPANNEETITEYGMKTEDTAPVTVTTSSLQSDIHIVDSTPVVEATISTEPSLNTKDIVSVNEDLLENIIHEVQVSPPGVCTADVECSSGDNIQNDFPHHEHLSQNNENAIMEGIHLDGNYWATLMYLTVTAVATLIFSLGYYCIENMRRDRQLIARINKLEKDLLISEAECTMYNENLKSVKDKLKRMEDESFGSDEMVLSLRADLEASQNARGELEDQVAMLERDLESATEAGLELEKMLREVLSSNNEVNPLAQSVEDLQTRLNTQQAANESLTNALSLKTQENESLSLELASVKKKYEELEVEFSRVTENLNFEVINKNSIVQTLNDKVQHLEMQIKDISTQKATLQKELKCKEVEAEDLIEVISKLKSNNLDLDKLYDVSRIKAEATALLEERNELKIRLTEVEGAHNLLEEHVKVIKEEIATLSEQSKVAEKEKKDAETRLEVLTNFFEEKEAQRQKEEAIWLQQQGEVVSTVERIQAMQSEIQNYKQQTEMLKREILDQEREYKGQISLLETKAHEQWVIARQMERRLEESKVEAGQLRNRLTLIEKNINDADSEAKLHRLEANGEAATSPSLFIGAESSNSPIMFSGSTNVPPPPPPSYLHSLFPPYLPPPLPNTVGVPPYEVSQRPPPLGGRLSSPPPMPPLHPPPSNRYDNAGSPPPMSPHLLPPFNHRSPPPPFGSDMHPPPLPPPGSILPPNLGAPHSWGEETLPPPRNSGFHPSQRDRVRNHKGSLHSSGESLDKSHHSKV